MHLPGSPRAAAAAAAAAPFAAEQTPVLMAHPRVTVETVPEEAMESLDSAGL